MVMVPQHQVYVRCTQKVQIPSKAAWVQAFVTAAASAVLGPGPQDSPSTSSRDAAARAPGGVESADSGHAAAAFEALLKSPSHQYALAS